VRSFDDLHRFADRFQRKIFGIEPGNNGNRMIGTMITQDRFGLGDWTLVESSEQGMLSEVDRAIRKSDWIVFLGWSPHPMNLKYRMQYLAGGDDTFGANYGGATIYTDVRAGYLAECPNVAALLANLQFTPDIESRMMALILDEHLEGRAAATQFLGAHPELVASLALGRHHDRRQARGCGGAPQPARLRLEHAEGRTGRRGRLGDRATSCRSGRGCATASNTRRIMRRDFSMPYRSPWVAPSPPSQAR
jgi:hypothetical protein